MLLTQDFTCLHVQTPHWQTQGYPFWLQSRFDLAPNVTNPWLFQMRFQYILALDLFHLGPVRPTFEPTLIFLPDTPGISIMRELWPGFQSTGRPYRTRSKQSMQTADLVRVTSYIFEINEFIDWWHNAISFCTLWILYLQKWQRLLLILLLLTYISLLFLTNTWLTSLVYRTMYAKI